MDKAVRAFAELLYRGHLPALTDLQTALKDWVTFYKQHADYLGFDVEDLQATWGDEPAVWDIIIDVGSLHGFVLEADDTMYFEDMAYGLQDLVPGQLLNVDWDDLAEFDEESEIEEFFRQVGRRTRKEGEVLIILDKNSGSFPLAFLPREFLSKARLLAEDVDNAELIIPGKS